MTKNIIVVDEQGKEYGATWPKRAKGLVKSGRARFISEDRICLACPPDIILEDNEMLDNEILNKEKVEMPNSTKAPEKLQMDKASLLQQMKNIQEQTDYLKQVIENLSKMSDGDSGDTGSPGNILGAAKAKALGDAVKCRETTNQELLRLYEKMYDDISGRSADRNRIFDLLEKIALDSDMASEDKIATISEISEILRHGLK